MEPNSATVQKNNEKRTGQSQVDRQIKVERAASSLDAPRSFILTFIRYAAYTTKSDMHTNFGDSTWLLIFPMTVLVGMVVMGIVNFIRLVCEVTQMFVYYINRRIRT